MGKENTLRADSLRKDVQTSVRINAKLLAMLKDKNVSVQKIVDNFLNRKFVVTEYQGIKAKK